MLLGAAAASTTPELDAAVAAAELALAVAVGP